MAIKKKTITSAELAEKLKKKYLISEDNGEVGCCRLKKFDPNKNFPTLTGIR